MLIMNGDIFGRLDSVTPKDWPVTDVLTKAAASSPNADMVTYSAPHRSIAAALMMNGTRDATGLVRLLVVTDRKIIYSAFATHYPVESSDEALYWHSIVEQAGVNTFRAETYSDFTGLSYWLPTSAREMAAQTRLYLEADIKTAVNVFLEGRAPIVLKVCEARPRIPAMGASQMLLKCDASRMSELLDMESISVLSLANAEPALLAHLVHADEMRAARFLGLKHADFLKSRSKGLRDLQWPVPQLVRTIKISKLLPSYPPVSEAEWRILGRVESVLRTIAPDKELRRRFLRRVFSQGVTPEASHVSQYLVDQALRLPAIVNFAYGFRLMNSERALRLLLNIVDAQTSTSNPTLEQLRTYLGGDSIAALGVQLAGHWRETLDNLFHKFLKSIGTLTFHARGLRLTVLNSVVKIRSVQEAFPSLRATSVLDLLLENTAAIAISPIDANARASAVVLIQSSSSSQCEVWDVVCAEGSYGSELKDLVEALTAHVAETDWMAKLRKRNVAFQKALRTEHVDANFNGSPHEGPVGDI